MPILECKRMMFLSALDEELFFAGLKEISAVKKFEGRGHSLFVTVAPKLSQKTLRELLGLFRRFGVDMHQLAQFETPRNRDWFRSPTAYWYRSVFGRSKKPNQSSQPKSLTRRG